MRVLVFLIGFWLLHSTGVTNAQQPVIPQPVELPFSVYMDGDFVGTHVITVAHTAQETQVNIAIDLTIKFGPIPIFTYTHRGRERWSQGALVSINTQTQENGEAMFLRLDRTATAMLEGESHLGRQALPGDLVPTSYWNRLLVAQNAILNTQDGEVLAVQVHDAGVETVTAFGQPVEAKKYVMSGDLRLQLWYDHSDRLVKLSFERRGRQFVYALEATGPS